MSKKIDEMFDFYLKTVKLDEKEISKVQLVETKRAFVAGIGQTLEYQLNSLAVKPENEAVKDLHNLLQETLDFWKNQSNNY